MSRGAAMPDYIRYEWQLSYPVDVENSMKEHVLRKRSSNRKKSGSTKVIPFVLVGCVSFLIVGIVLALFVFKGFIPFGRGLTLDIPNAKVTPENYALLKSGATISEVEAILGKGRLPNSDDFDAICGDKEQRFTNPYFNERSSWEENNRRGLLLIWVNVYARLVVTFSDHPNRGGRLLRKVMLMQDGSIISEASNNFLFAPIGPNNPEPQPNQNPNADPAEWEKLVGTWEIQGDPRFRIRFGADKKIGDIFMHEGRQIREKIFSVREVKIENGRIAPQVSLGTVNGKGTTSAAMGVFWFENGTLHRDPGSGFPIQKLLRVNK